MLIKIMYKAKNNQKIHKTQDYKQQHIQLKTTITTKMNQKLKNLKNKN